MMSSNITGAVVSSTPGIRYTIPPSSSTTSVSASSAAAAVKINFIASLPLLSPVSAATGVVGQAPQSAAAAAHGTPAISSNLSTPKKDFLDAVILEKIRQQLRFCGTAAAAATATATTVCDIQQLRIESTGEIEHLNLLKDRYLLSSSNNSKETRGSVAPSTRNQIVDLSTSNLKCVDVFTEQNFLCKIINEPLDKVQLAYFNLLQDSDGCTSAIYGHNLIRRAHDIVPLSKNRTYVIIPDRTANGSSVKPGGVAYNNKSSNSSSSDNCPPVYEDLHTYIRNKRRLSESEARALFHQISQTVQVCHRNGIILRDLKLKRFFFVDAERTKLEYESLEGSMILDNPDNDLLSDKIGCPLYTAPELLCPHPTYNGKPADMWSLGVILYTMLVGQYPFYEKNNCNLIAIIRHCQVQLPSALSKSVCFLLRSLLRKNHTERILAEDIFYVPWLKEQKPYYMSIPVDVQFSSDEDEDEDMEYDMAATANDLA